ncbi:hypothetical protein BY996DRAFT_6524777 [Phakopsora pachyrhizi]|nr:hypothetical protein BY996DRAFT_6524777 [Phakopsora pachyrhizi]
MKRELRSLIDMQEDEKEMADNDDHHCKGSTKLNNKADDLTRILKRRDDKRSVGMLGSTLDVQTVAIGLEKHQERGKLPDKEMEKLNSEYVRKLLLISWKGTRFELGTILRQVVDNGLSKESLEGYYQVFHLLTDFKPSHREIKPSENSQVMRGYDDVDLGKLRTIGSGDVQSARQGDSIEQLKKLELIGSTDIRGHLTRGVRPIGSKIDMVMLAMVVQGNEMELWPLSIGKFVKVKTSEQSKDARIKEGIMNNEKETTSARNCHMMTAKRKGQKNELAKLKVVAIPEAYPAANSEDQKE